MSGAMGSMMSGGGVDAKIPLGFTGNTNPLQSLGGVLDMAGKANQLKLFPGQLQKQQLEIQSGAASLANHLTQVGANAMIPALSDDNLTMDRLTHYAGAAEGIHGGITHGIMGQVAAIPYAPDTPEWSRAVKGIIASQAQTNPEAAVSQVAGTPVDQNTGQAINSGVRAPAYAGGGVKAGSSTDVYPSRESLAGRVTGPVGPNGEQTTAPLGAVTPPALSGLPMGNGRLNVPAALLNPNAPSPPAGTPLPGQVTTGVGPGAEHQLATSGAQSAQKFQSVADEATQAKEQDAILANMQNDLTQFASGPGAHTYNDLQKIIQGWVPGANAAWKTKIAANESFDKLANQLVSAASPGSDARQGVLQGATPSSAQSPEGVDFILRQLRGMNDYKLARGNLAAVSGVDRANYPAWQSKTAATLNPQVFQFARLTPAQKADFLDGIPAKEQASFKKQYLAAKAAGFYGVDNGGQ